MMDDHKEFYRKVGELIRSQRKNSGLSQEGLAKAIGLKRPSMSNIEKGRQNILLHTLYDIAETLGTNADALLPARKSPAPSKMPDLRPYSKGVRDFVKAAIKSTSAES
jgi:transcriptional regulator with XRE-family HTH domain